MAGWLADRYPRRRIIVFTALASALFACILALLLWRDALSLLGLCILLTVLSALSAIRDAALMSTTPFLVNADNLPRANSLLQTSQSLETLLAPLLGAVAFTAMGVHRSLGLCASLSVLGGIMCQFVQINDSADQLSLVEPTTTRGESTGGLLAGFAELRRGSGFLLKLALYSAVVNLCVNAAGVLIIPRVLLIANTGGLAVVQLVSGIGGVAGSILLGGLGKNTRGRLTALISLNVSCAAAMMAMAWSGSLVLVAISYFLVTTTALPTGAIIQSIFQTNTPPDHHGAVYGARVLIGRAPVLVTYFGAGALAEWLGRTVFAERSYLFLGDGLPGGLAAVLLGGAVLLACWSRPC